MDRIDEQRQLLNTFTTLELVNELRDRIITHTAREGHTGVDELMDEVERREIALFEMPDDDLPPPVPWPAP